MNITRIYNNNIINLIKWMDRITNEEVLGRIGERRTLWKCLKKRKDQMMGHTLRRGGLLRDILEGVVGMKRGRPRLKYFDQIIGDMGCETFREVKELAGMGQSRVETGGCVKPVLGLCTQ